ncbi:hypothetical protein GOBAR_DD19895 [Gossypium barbadense]|nr:hypothetical protein GOBAR_DD19895 [Gossypium barbadense]
MEGQTNTSFRQWLDTMEPWQWAQSFNEGFHYGQMTINLVEGINAFLLKTRHLPIASVFSAIFYRLATLIPRMGQQQVDQMEAGHLFAEHVRDAMLANRWMARSYGVDLRNRRCECRTFETLHYPYAHVVAVYAKVNLTVEQYVDDLYTLERTLRVWENEFPVLSDLSTLEVPPTTFELLPDRGLRRNPRGHPQSSRIRNEMNIREKSDGVYQFGGQWSRFGCLRRPTSLFDAARSASTNLNRKESHDAADTGRACHTAVGRIKRVQTRMRILPLRSSKYSHCPPNPDYSYLNPHVNVIVWDLVRAPAQALVPEHNMPQAPPLLGPLGTIPQVSACAGGLQSTGLQVYMASRNYSTIVCTLIMVANRKP